MRQNLLEEPNS